MIAHVNSRPIKSEPRLEIKVTSDPANLSSARKAVEALASRVGFDDKAVAEIGLCLNEAMANIIRHAYSGKTDKPIHVTAAFAGKQLSIEIRDWGSGIDPSTLPCRPYDPLEPGGVGLICLNQWMDRVSYTPQNDGMLTILQKKLKVPAKK